MQSKSTRCCACRRARLATAIRPKSGPSTTTTASVNFGLGEHEALSTVAMIASGIEKHGPAFAAWVSYVGESSADLIEQFEDRFLGQWESLQAYAEYLLDELRGGPVHRSEAPEWLRGHLSLDVAGFARDLEMGGDVVDVGGGGRSGVWVFAAS